MRPDGSAYTRVTDNPAHDTRPAWAGSTRLIFVRQVPFSDDVDLFAINPTGSGEAPLSPGQIVDVWTEMRPAVSPEGTRIAFSSDRDGDAEIWIMNADGTNSVQITHNDVVADFDPDWSPTGEAIVFTRSPFGGLDEADVWTVKPDGSALTQLTDYAFGDHQPSWSPDGRRIAFISERTGHSDIYVMKHDGTALKQVTATPQSGVRAGLEPVTDD